MTPERLQEIEARAQAATPGPWDWEPHGWKGELGKSEMDEALFAGPGTLNGYPIHRLNILNAGADWDWNERANKAFIAAARTDIPDLLAEVRQLQSEVKHWRDSFAETLCFKNEPPPRSDVLAEMRLPMPAWFMEVVGASFADCIRKEDGSGWWNSIEWTIYYPGAGLMTLTLQRLEGKTAAQQRQEAEEERDRLAAEVRRLQSIVAALMPQGGEE